MYVYMYVYVIYVSPSGYSVQWVPGGTQHKFYITVTVLVVVWIAIVNVGSKLEAQPSTITASCLYYECN